MNREFPFWLRKRLTERLPGPMTGSRFESQPPPVPGYDAEVSTARQAAVLVLLYPKDDQWHVPLAIRPRHLPDHGGQVCLPGGMIEPGERAAEAAEREYYEELGATAHRLEQLGRLSPIYVAASNFRVEPWVACAWSPPQWNPNTAEVAGLLEVPLAHLLDHRNFAGHWRRGSRGSYYAPHFQWNEHRIWGATCMILGELVTLIESPLR